jgi:hypothetical protein
MQCIELFIAGTCTHVFSLLLQAMLSKLGALAAGAAIFLGGYTTGIASSSMVADVRTAEVHRQELTAPAPASLPVKPVSLALPDQVGSCSSTGRALPCKCDRQEAE